MRETPTSPEPNRLRRVFGAVIGAMVVIGAFVLVAPELYMQGMSKRTQVCRELNRDIVARI